MNTYYIKQKVFSLKDRYFVYDKDEQPVYEVNGKFFSVGAELTISDLNGSDLYRIKQRVLSFLGAYDIYENEHLCASIKRQASFFRPKLTVESNENNYKIEGDFWDYNFSITKDGHTIGLIKKEWFTFGDSYKLTVNDSESEALFITLVIAIDHCLHNNKNSN